MHVSVCLAVVVRAVSFCLSVSVSVCSFCALSLSLSLSLFHKLGERCRELLRAEFLYVMQNFFEPQPLLSKGLGFTLLLPTCSHLKGAALQHPNNSQPVTVSES